MGKERSVGNLGPGTRFTPGPWKWDDGWGAVVSCGEVTRIVCPMWTGCNRATMSDVDSEIDAANARLIAAAPELAEACRLVMERYGHLDEMTNPCVQACRAALTKAGLIDPP